MPTTPRTRHTVTAIIVSHDGARLLPGLVQALRAQTYPVEQTVAVDTGSRDRSGAVLAELIGQDAVFGMDRSTGYGEAVTVALRHATRRRSGMTDPSIARVEWIWLLHDDCEPAPDALEKLLRAAAKDRTVVVLGPKVLDGQDRRTLREVGVSIDRAGRRVTGIDPGEIDQGQHDHKRAVLAVGSAGMLVRRDVWDRLRGFDPYLKLFRDDIDFCWRVQAAGARVQVVTDAVLYHHELAARRRRPIDDDNARRLDRRNALFVLAVNLPLLTMLRVVGGCVAGSLVRAAYFLLTKQLDQAAAYAFSVLSLLGHPVRLWRGRGRRARTMAEGYTAVRVFIQPARTLSKLAEKIAGLLSNGPPQASGGRHVATEESEEDEQFVEGQSLVRRVIGHPAVQLVTVLLLVSVIAERRLLDASPLGGGALVPAWGGAAALWQEYLAGFHVVSVGSTAPAPPYLAVVAALATVLGGQAWLAVDVLLLGCVPLAGLTAYLASRRLVTAVPARVLLAASYALLPVATGAVAAGRLGTSTAFVLLPLIGLSAGRMLTAAPRQARRAAWATGLLIALASAFAPLAWVLGVAFAFAARGARRWLPAADPLNVIIVIVTPFFVLFPWSLHLLGDPAAFWSEAGLAPRGLTTAGLTPTALLALSPGGPGVPPVWVTLGFGLALVATVLHDRRSSLVIAGWTVAVAGLLTATLVSRISVTPPSGGQASAGWPGVAVALAALGLLLAAAPAAQRLAAIVTNSADTAAPGSATHGGQPAAVPARPAGHRGSVRLAACAALAAAATAPLLVAAYWVRDGVQGPVGSVTAPVLPAFVAAASTSGQQYRTLILRPDQAGLAAGGLDYMVVRQGDPALGDPELGIDSAAGAALSHQVASLGAPDGADAGDPGMVLGSFGIRWVLLPGPVSPVLAQRLDGAVGLVALSKAPTYDLWQVTGPVARVRVIAPDGTTTALSSSAQNEGLVTAPASGGTLVLAEPYGGWTATLNGRALKPLGTPVSGWAQGFVLPPGGGRLSITHDNLARELSLFLELAAVLAVCLLALPGKRADPVEEAEAVAALREARTGRRAASAGRPARTARGRPARVRGAVHRAVGDAGRPGFARGRGAGRLSAGVADQSRDFTESAGDIAEPTSARPTSARTTSAGTTSAEAGSAPGANLGAPPSAGPVRVPDLRDGNAADAPWDMAGDWGSRPRVAGTDGSAAATRGDAWGTSPLVDAGRRGARARLTGQQPSVPETSDLGAQAPETQAPETRAAGTRPSGTGGPQTSDPWETGPQTSDPWETGPQTSDPWETGPQTSDPWGTGPQTSDPWGTGPQRAPWESGPQPPVSSTGAQSRYAWETGPQPPVSSTGVSATGAQPRYLWETGPQRPATPAGGQPAATGGQPVTRARSEPAARTGAQPVAPAGAEAVPPWESGEWPQAGDPVSPGLPGALPEPRVGSGPWPLAAPSARPERHSHRAAKHGRPGRWRGAGKRSGGDGES